eukprot:TRINITY_DN51727_c0_g1_i1.p1 TRINITY_DN51727_c0_g1~~TRINITY_DN51727_c0_g1_i1.p1  ORF type:complete len:357 (-),score=67.09 TRINITY_DN51727_c0_g1_i1:139-1209(-)
MMTQPRLDSRTMLASRNMYAAPGEDGPSKLEELLGSEVESQASSSEEEELVTGSLSNDVWNLAVVCIIRILDYHNEGPDLDKIMWYFSSFILWLTNIALQMGLVAILLVNVIQPMEASVAPPIFDIERASKILTDPAVQGHKLVDAAHIPEAEAALILQRCKELNASGIEVVQICLMFLWTAKMLSELLDTNQLRGRLCSIRRRQHAHEEMIDEHVLVCLDRQSLIAIYIAVLIPKVIVGITTWWIGSRLIVYGRTVTFVILKGLAMQFIVSIDELLSTYFSSVYTQELFDVLKMQWPRKGAGRSWRMWANSLLKVILVASLTGLYLFVFEGKLPQLRRSCDVYQAGTPFDIYKMA